MKNPPITSSMIAARGVAQVASEADANQSAEQTS
jgi:hypothetical protein